MNSSEQIYFSYTPSEVIAAVAAFSTPTYVSTLVEILGDLENKRVLDVGCGTGLLAEVATKAKAADVVGIDISRAMIDTARQRAAYLQLPIRYLRQNALQMRFEPETFDVVMCHFFLHTLSNPILALQEMARVSRNDALLVAIEPVEQATLFSSVDIDFCQQAQTFVDMYQRLATQAGFDFNLGMSLPGLLAQTDWQPFSINGFLHAFWTPPELRTASGNGFEQMVTWRQKLQEVASLAGQEVDCDLPIFSMALPSDLLTTSLVMIAIGKKVAYH